MKNIKQAYTANAENVPRNLVTAAVRRALQTPNCAKLVLELLQEQAEEAPEEAVVELLEWHARHGAADVESATAVCNWVRDNCDLTQPLFAATVKVVTSANIVDQACELHRVLLSEKLELDDALRARLNKMSEPPRKHHARAHRDCEQEGESRLDKVDTQQIMSQIRACGQEGNAEEALALLRDLESQGDVDTSVYNCALDACVTCGAAQTVEEIFQGMRKCGHVDIVSYNILAKQRLSEGARAYDLLAEIRANGLNPNLATYNSLLSAILATKDVAGAWRMVDEMQRQGLGADVYTLSILFKGYKKEHQVMDAAAFDRCMGLIRKHNMKIDEVLVNVALEACMLLRDERRLTDTLDLLERNGWNRVHQQCSLHTYGIFIKACGQAHRLGAAQRIWCEITRDRGLKPSEQLYGQMIDVLVTNDRLDEALNVFGEMKASHGDRVDSQGFAVAYAMLIKGFAQRKECQNALDIYEEMQEHGARVGLVVFNSLIDACSRVGDMDNAAKLFKDMMEADCAPDLITYSTLIKGYCVRDELDHAMELFALMRRKGIKPDSVVFNSLLDGCAKQQQPALCQQLMDDMEEEGVLPNNYSASILIKLYGRCKDVDNAFRVLDTLPKKYGFRPNAAVYTCLMSTCISNNRLDLAMDLLRRMSESRVRHDEKMYSTLLRGALKVGSVDHCLSIVGAALEQGPYVGNLLDMELLRSVLVLVQRRHLWNDRGEELLARLQNAGYRVQQPTASETMRHNRRGGGGGGNSSNNSGPAASTGKPQQRRRERDAK